MAHADLLLVVQIGPKKAISRGFTKFFSELLDCNRSFKYLLIESPNIFHWKSTKKKVGLVLDLGAKFGPN